MGSRAANKLANTLRRLRKQAMAQRRQNKATTTKIKKKASHENDMHRGHDARLQLPYLRLILRFDLAMSSRDQIQQLQYVIPVVRSKEELGACDV